MAGGGGTRLWPASRRSHPKQLLTLHGERSLLQETWARLEGVVEPERILVVTGTEQAADVQAQLPALRPENLLAEPEGRNTLPCVAWAAAEIARRAPDSLQIVLPADHVIEPAEAFRDTLRAGLAAAGEQPGRLVTLGIRPTHPATGFGYVETGRALGEALGQEILPVTRFVEKPDAATAQEFLRQGNFYWNSGAFLWSTASIVAALQAHAPATWQALDGRSAAEVQAAYRTLESISVDHGLMEKASGLVLLPIGYLWSDVGSWPALDDVLPADPQDNRVGGGATLIAQDARNNIVYAPDGHTVSLVGVEGLVVVQAGDATLICPKDRAQEVRDLVERLKTERPDLL